MSKPVLTLEALENLAREMRHMLRVNPSKDGGLYRQRLDEADAAIAAAKETQKWAEVSPAALIDAAERVCWFDWSGNDEDAVQAIDGLRELLASRLRAVSQP